jgi:hypothetical protein
MSKKRTTLWATKGRNATQKDDCAVSRDGKRYWLTPPDMMKSLDDEFHFDFDACPYPRPEGYDSLQVEEWGRSTYINPPFKGPTKWIKKAVAEVRKGKQVVLVFPQREWMAHMLSPDISLEIRSMGRVRWRAVEDGSPSKGNPWMIYAFIMKPAKKKRKK